MKKHLFGAFLLSGTIFVLTGRIETAWSAGSESDYQVTATVGGRVVALSPGMVIATGTRTGDVCRFPSAIEVSATVPDDQGLAAVEIRTHVNELCQMVVESAGPIENPPTQPPPEIGASEELGANVWPPEDGTAAPIEPLAVVNHYGWTKHRVEEYVNIPVTYIYVEMKYKRDGNRVYGGSGALCRMWNDGAGWTQTMQACNTSGSGPSSVYVYGRAKFSSWIPPQPSYALSARFTADPGPRHTCSVSQGTIPLGWDAICSGGLYYEATARRLA